MSTFKARAEGQAAESLCHSAQMEPRVYLPLVDFFCFVLFMLRVRACI